MKHLQIIKRDGSKEPFDLDKIARVVTAAGLEPDETDRLVNKLTDWINSLNKVEISSLEVRDQVLLALDSINTSVANLFRWYQKTRT